MIKSALLAAALAVLACANLPAQHLISPSFFGITLADTDKYPTISFGAMGHPPGIGWGFIEPSKGTYRWGTMDAYVRTAQNNGMDIIITFAGTPRWAAADVSKCESKFSITSCTSPPADIQDWKDFITEVVHHYNGVTAPHIAYYEIWNEANTRNSFTGTYADLVKMAEAAYPIIHTDPQAQVLTPSVVGSTGGPLPENAPMWMDAYLKAGGAKYADIGAFHGYIFRSSLPIGMPEQSLPANCLPNPTNLCQGSILTLISTLRSVFDANGMAGKPIFDTEGSWGRSTLTDPDEQVEFLSRWYILQAGAGISRAYWYEWASSSVNDWGPMINPGGKVSTAALAYGHINDWLSGASITGCIVDVDHTSWGCNVSRANGYKGRVIWNTAGTTTRIVNSIYTQFRDLAGNMGGIPEGGSVTIGPKPILVETNTP